MQKKTEFFHPGSHPRPAELFLFFSGWEFLFGGSVSSSIRNREFHPCRPIAGARHDAGYIPGYAYIPSVRSQFHTNAHFGNEVVGTVLGTQWKRVGTSDVVLGNNSLGTICLCAKS